jgi:hypothetical protein
LEYSFGISTIYFAPKINREKKFILVIIDVMPKKSRIEEEEEEEGQQQLFILFFCFGCRPISHPSPCAYIFASSYLFCDCAIFARPPAGEESFIFCVILNQK